MTLLEAEGHVQVYAREVGGFHQIRQLAARLIGAGNHLVLGEQQRMRVDDRIRRHVRARGAQRHIGEQAHRRVDLGGRFASRGRIGRRASAIGA